MENSEKELQTLPPKIGLKNIDKYQKVCVNQLPPIGTIGYVRRRSTEEYVPNFFDAWKKEMLYEVVDYTRGINCPFHKKNMILLRPMKKGISHLVRSEFTRYFAAGYYRFFEEESHDKEIN